MRSRVWGGAPSAALAAACALAAGAPPAHAADSCPNAAIRAAQHADLPDCRAYEMVSPVDKAGFSITTANGANYGNGSYPYASAVLRDGDGYSYIAGGAVGDPAGQDGLGIAYRALRGSSGWSSVPVNGPFGPPAPALLAATWNQGISEDGSRSIVMSPAALVEGAWPCVELQTMCLEGNLYLQDNETRERRLITGLTYGGGEPLTGPRVMGATADLRKVLVTSLETYTADAQPGVPNLYEWTDTGTPHGQLRLVGIGPDDQPLPAGAAAGQGSDPSNSLSQRTLSADGRRVFFASGGQLYLREDGEHTTHVSASQRTTPDPDGPLPATYWTAESAHGDAVFFTSEEKLTDDSEATTAAPDLYRYDVETGELLDVTATGQAAGVLGVIGASDDASTVYFAATAKLDPDAGTAGQVNVYGWYDDGTPEGQLWYVATLGTVAEATAWDTANWATGSHAVPPVAVSGDGRFLALLSAQPLTEHDTAGTVQVYLHDADAGTLACASCAPDGSPSSGDAGFRQIERTEAFRVVSDHGDVGFQTEQALLPTDRNGVRDVYVFGESGPRLVSTGADGDLSTFAGLSRSGRDVFFSTRERLVDSDVDDLVDLYDARIDGGFEAAPSPAPCEGDACQGRPAGGGPTLADPATRSFSGPGNVPAPAKKRATTKKVRAGATARGMRVRVRIQAPGAGRVTVSGASLRTTRKTVRQAQSVTVSVRLTAKAARRLTRNGRLRVSARVAFTPTTGRASSTTVAVTMKEQR